MIDDSSDKLFSLSILLISLQVTQPAILLSCNAGCSYVAENIDFNCTYIKVRKIALKQHISLIVIF